MVLSVEIETSGLKQSEEIVRSEISSVVVALKRLVRSVGRAECFHFSLIQFANADENRSMSEGLFVVEIKVRGVRARRTEENRTIDELMRSIVKRKKIEPIDEQIREIRVQRSKFEMERVILVWIQRDEVIVEERKIRQTRDVLQRHFRRMERTIVRNPEDEWIVG